MEIILKEITDEKVKRIFMLYGDISGQERRSILTSICSLGPTATVEFSSFKRKGELKFTPTLVAAEYLLIDKTLHQHHISKLYGATLKELVHGDVFDVNYGQLSPKKLVFICDCELPGQLFVNDSALVARMKFIHISK